ncbi:MAG: Endopolygalacturonase [Rhodobacteraceae bacterium HLUCCA08]|nr:MAG: Endopolygalacturonase [Rhodobacteraceae bacterium HLUCCA08]
MNVVITQGLELMPAPFADGLDVWSSGDGTPGSDTYAGSGSGSYLPADQDFAGCLEILKTQATQKLRYMAQTPILPGVYLQVTARVKAVGGALPAVRIAGYAARPGGANLAGAVQTGPETQLTSYGDVVEIRAIIGTGPRAGVDMVWTGAAYGHIGLDLTGANGGVVRIDDLRIEDVTGYFLRDMFGVVDVRDYGARGDGVTDDSAAFEAADDAAGGREVLVSAGTYFLGQNVTFENQVRFEGRVTMDDQHMLIFQKNFDYATYVDAFGDEELALRKAVQALLNFSDHESLDLNGRRIALTGPVDVQAAVANKAQFEVRRVIRNGQLEAMESPAWAPDVVTSQAAYSIGDPLRLTGVVNAGAIAPGSLVEGNGVGREVYVTSVNAAAQTIALSAPLYDAQGTQVYTFTRFKYLLDLSGFSKLSQFELADIEFQCNGLASGILLPPDGIINRIRDCTFQRCADRGVTSHGRGCQGMMIDRCMFNSKEQAEPVQNRTSIALNANANDVKLRDNVVARWKAFAVLGGSGSVITGNHWYGGDDELLGIRRGGLILTLSNCMTTICGNYIDNNFIEWTNEHDASPDFGNEFGFGGLTVTGNICVVIDSEDWFNWIVVKPYGEGQFIAGLTVSHNVFRTLNTRIDRIERVDTTFADLDYTRMRNITFEGNIFNGIDEEVRNPLSVVHAQSTEDDIWVVETGTALPFGGWARVVEALVPIQTVTNAAGQPVHAMPAVDPAFGPDNTQVRLIWPEPVKGEVRVKIRMDNPSI